MNDLTSLYYPFSRCVNPASLKQLLLVFDRVCFVDPVDDDHWRNKLFRDLEQHDQKFSNYRTINASLPDLLDHGCIKRIDPVPFRERNLASASALADLKDEGWVRTASMPRKYHMPSIEIGGKPSWQTFLPKLPEPFLDGLMAMPGDEGHLLAEGDEWSSWSLSYAAGSAIGISLHLEIAEDVGASPVTDSSLHHRLLLMKLARDCKENVKDTPIPEDAVRYLTSGLASTMLAEILPEDRILNIPFDEIIKFRSETAQLRKQFFSDIETRLAQLKCAAQADDWLLAGRQTLGSLRAELQKYEAEFVANRDKLWPGLVSSLNSAIVSGGLGAIAVSYIGGPGHALLASLGGAAVGLAKTQLEVRAEGRKLINTTSPSIAYLSKVEKHFA